MKLSIIIPAYNVESYLHEALVSVFSQTVMPSEVILVNDGSDDDTLKVAESFIGQHPNYKIYTTQNQGLGLARNYGLEKASGDYVYFFDADDLLEASFAERISEIIRENKNPDLVCFSGESFIDENYASDFSPNYKRSINKIFISGKDAFDQLSQKEECFPSACLYLAKKSFLDINELRFKPVLHEDEEILFPLFFLANKTLVIDEIFFYRRIRCGSIMQSKATRKNFEGYISVMERLIDFRRVNPEVVKENKSSWKKRGQNFLVAAYSSKKNFRFSLFDYIAISKFFLVFADFKTFLKLSFYSTPESVQLYVKNNKLLAALRPFINI